MKKLILSFSLAITCALSCIIPGLYTNKASASNEAFSVSTKYSSLMEEEIMSSSEYRNIEAGEDLSNATIYICIQNHDGITLSSGLNGIYFSPGVGIYGELRDENTFTGYDSLINTIKIESLDVNREEALEITITGDFDNVKCNKTNYFYIKNINTEEESSLESSSDSILESSSDSILESSSDMLFDKAHDWVNEKLGIGLSVSMFGTILLIVVLYC